MPERHQALMRTRCPVCGTVFRVTTEQLRLKAGKVRCGHCQALFNAFDELLPEDVEPAAIPENDTPPAAETPLPAPGVPAVVEFPETLDADLPSLPEPEPEPEPVRSLAESEALTETPEETTLAAREAGLVAARELSDTPGYNRWAAGTLAGSGLGGFNGESARRAVWPFVLFSILLVLALFIQLAYHYRTEIVVRLPDTATLYEFATVDVPLARNSDLVAIDASDLQLDGQRGLFVLQATLRNRASHAQAWPALELTLTDTHDTVVSRRVLLPPDYLPPSASPAAFPGNGEVAVRLWVEAKGIGAAGYRLYVFYP